jgi:hypothetical protein
MIDAVENDNIYSLYTESKLGKIAAGVAMGAASIMGAPNVAVAGDSNQREQSSSWVLNDVSYVIDIWSKYYQTDDNATTEQKALARLEAGVNVPKSAWQAIDIAAYIFDGDNGVQSNILKDLLSYTGQIESQYRTRVQTGGGPARGYWQVEPKTAVDLFINSQQFFGKKFDKQFGSVAKYLKSLKVNDIHTQNKVAELILNDDNLAASLSAAVWVRTAKNWNK